MKNIIYLIVLHVGVCTHSLLTPARADVIFESGTLGPTGITWQQVLDDEVVGSNVASDVFSGVRFKLVSPVMTTRIGGHFVSAAGGEFFGAIVKLTDQNDFPDSGDLSTPDVLGSAIVVFPAPSAEVFGNLSLSLQPGWHALVFGSGLFTTTGAGAMPLNNPDIGNPSYIAWQTGDGWFNLADLSDVFDFDDYRFVVEGTIVPEPSSTMLVALAIFVIAVRRSVFAR
jgi:hypothetical protein